MHANAHLAEDVHDEAQGVDVDDGALQHVHGLLHVVRQGHQLAGSHLVQVAAELDLPVSALLLQLGLEVLGVQGQGADIVQGREGLNLTVHVVEPHELTVIVVQLGARLHERNVQGI
jgi:hypothetical protein